MAIFKFGNFETEIDTSDFDFMQKYEEAEKRAQEEERDAKKDGAYSEIIEGQYSVIFSFFDSVFGAGTSEMMFEGKKNIRLCNRAIGEFNDAVFSDASALADEISATATKYTGSREQRRRTKK